MDWPKKRIYDCGTPFVYESFELGIKIARLANEPQVHIPLLEKYGISMRQAALLLALRFHGPRTANTLANIAGIGLGAAMDELAALQREGFVLIEPAPTEYDTPQVEKTERAAAIAKEIEKALADCGATDDLPDAARSWLFPLPRV